MPSRYVGQFVASFYWQCDCSKCYFVNTQFVAKLVKELYNIVMKVTKIITNNVIETEQFAKQFAQTLTGGEVLLLHGDLGAGKTHFVKGLAVGLDIADVITSPTFTIHNVYYGKLTLNHFDFYRIEDSMEAEMLGLSEFFGEPTSVCAVEWSENIVDLLPNNCIDVTINKLGQDQREIIISTK